MAEAIAAVGVAATILQLVDFSTKVLARLNEFQSNLREVPKSFRQISTTLPLLCDTLAQIQGGMERGSFGDRTKEALLPALKGCQDQVGELDAILTKSLPKSDDSRLQRGMKAISSVGHDGKVERISKDLHRYITTLTFYCTAVSSTLRPLEDTNLKRIRQWLSPPDPSLNHHIALKLRQAGTGLWFLNGDEYAKWSSNGPATIWLHGMPGCGKSILSSSIIENILQRCEGDPGKVVAYFYFDFKDKKKQSPDRMIRSIICQLSQQCVKAPLRLESLFSSCEGKQQQPTIDDLLAVLQEIIQEYPESYIILDALDECENRVELMTVAEQIIGWQLDRLHFLVTSRKERDIQDYLENLVDKDNIICLQSHLVDGDIRKYVEKRLLEDRDLKKWHKDPDIRAEIETALMKGAHGMFRWAACQLDTLGKCRNRLMLRNSLKTLPPTLDETYDRILCSIRQEDVDYAIRILRWLAFSARPLRVKEVSEVVAIDIERDPAFARQEVLEDPLEVFDICPSLVTIATFDAPEDDDDSIDFGPDDEIVQLAHYSVKEYLTSDRICQSRAQRYSIQAASCNEFLAHSCLGYISQFDVSNSFTSEEVEDFQLTDYAFEFWVTHTQAAGEIREPLKYSIINLLLHRNHACLHWIKVCERQFGSYDPAIHAAPLHLVSVFGLMCIAEQLLASGADVNPQCVFLGTPLQAAAGYGNENMVEWLLTAGADVNAQGGYLGSALQAAAARVSNDPTSNKRIVETLLSAGAYLNAESGYYGTALQAASHRGNEKVVELLLSDGANINAQSGYYGTALQAASANGHQKVVELLLGAGANINAQGGVYGTALQAASPTCHDKLVELLLGAGANVNAPGGRYGSALQAAVFWSDDKTIELLLSAGADFNARNGRRKSAFEVATSRGSERIAKLMLDAGAVDT